MSPAWPQTLLGLAVVLIVGGVFLKMRLLTRAGIWLIVLSLVLLPFQACLNSATERPALRSASAPATPTAHAPKYVAFGDSLTTGESVLECRDSLGTFNFGISPWGCVSNQPPANPYPDLVAQRFGYSFTNDPSEIPRRGAQPQYPGYDLDRVGTWGYTVRWAFFDSGGSDTGSLALPNDPAMTGGWDSRRTWVPQLTAIASARELITGALGVNDLGFSNVGYWMGVAAPDIAECLATIGVKPLVGVLVADACPFPHTVQVAKDILQADSRAFDALFAAIAQAKAAHPNLNVVIVLYYNPISADASCFPLHQLAGALVQTLDDELMRRAQPAGYRIVDMRKIIDTAPLDHGVGSADPWVWGNNCDLLSAVADAIPSWLQNHGLGLVAGALNLTLLSWSYLEHVFRGDPNVTGFDVFGLDFDPHPNPKGTHAMADAVIGDLASGQPGQVWPP